MKEGVRPFSVHLGSKDGALVPVLLVLGRRVSASFWVRWSRWDWGMEI